MKFKSAFFLRTPASRYWCQNRKKHKMRMCGHVSGYTRVGGRMAVFCPTPTVGRYVQVQIVKGDSNYLSSAEVIVWGRKVRYHYRKDTYIILCQNFTLVFLFVKKNCTKLRVVWALCHIVNLNLGVVVCKFITTRASVTSCFLTYWSL